MNEPAIEPALSYLFTAPEREFFAHRLVALNAQQLALRDAVSLVIGQQGLAGTWRISDDGAGLLKVPEALPPAT